MDRIIRDIRDYFEYLRESGCQGLPFSNKTREILDRWGRRDDLGDIRNELKDCHRCKLCAGRKNIVFGKGDPHARLVFVGEGPGYEEDIQGEPFVGAAGRLLTDIIKAINLTRNEVYICNVVKCRPPQNRTPEPEEIRECKPFLLRQLKAICPKVVCTLGAVATQALLKTNEAITRLRGKSYDYQGMCLIPTYHPAYLLRNPGKKRETWEDIQMVQKKLSVVDYEHNI
ncbi:MAG: uracil-DNA glycosylase [Pseudomonadota bacterium]